MCPLGFLINQCQIITFLILKSDIENSRIELRGIVLPVPSNQIKATFINILPFNLVHCDFSCFAYKLKEKVGGLSGGGGGAKSMLGPPFELFGGLATLAPQLGPFQIIWGPGPLAPPLPTPMI